MGLFKRIGVFIENQDLKKENEELCKILGATENRLMEREKEYRNLLGIREQQRQKIEFLDNSLFKANKTIDSIVEVAQSNGYGNNKNKLQKIIELAKFGDETSSINK